LKTTHQRKTPTLFIDGAARGNPGPAAAGVALFNEKGRILQESGFFLGEATNNVAETLALILGLQQAILKGVREITVLTDSELLAHQVTGRYRVKDHVLTWLHVAAQQLIRGFKRFEIRHIPREENRRADRLAAKAVLEGIRRQGKPKGKPSPTSSSAAAAQPTFW
jgi:ribonuclease HI